MAASEHPAKVATPLKALSGLVVQLSAPDEGVSWIEADEEVTTLPPESSTWTTGWALKATPLVELPGEALNTSLGGRPGGHGDVRRGGRREAVTGEGEGVDGAVRAVESQAEKVATPLEKVPEVPPAAMEPPAPEAIDALAVPELTETTLPPESSTLTTGWVPRAAPEFAVLEGSVVMTSWVAAPVDTVMVFDTAVVSPPSENVKV